MLEIIIQKKKALVKRLEQDIVELEILNGILPQADVAWEQAMTAHAECESEAFSAYLSNEFGAENYWEAGFSVDDVKQILQKRQYILTNP